MENELNTTYTLTCKEVEDAAQVEMLLEYLYKLDPAAFYQLISKYAEVS
jgi:hypothetical protein